MNLENLDKLIIILKKRPQENKTTIIYYEKKRIELIKEIESTIKSRLKNELNINI